MALDTMARFDAASRLVAAVTGEPYGDGCMVTDIGIGVAERGYGYSDTVWVLGNFNDKTTYADGVRTVTDDTPSRLFNALERIGVSAEWLDEWHRCDGCKQIVRSKPDSYCWQPSYATLGDNIYCVDCATGDYLDETIAEYVGESGKCLTAALVSASELESHGFTRFNIPPAENGWHPGQDDTPDGVVAHFEAEHGTDAEWLFYLDETSQFYIRFTLFYRLSTVEA
jgi:hypothetical protein